MVNICEAVKFHSFSHSLQNGKFRSVFFPIPSSFFCFVHSTDKCYHISSFSEGRASELIAESAEDFVKHTRRQLVRIYPAATRIASSNNSSFPYWAVGSQIVALNYQTNCKEMRLYRGLFHQNGNCGYVLKPSYLTDDTLSFQLERETLQKYLKVKIISGQYLPKVGESEHSIIDPYVTIKIMGHSTDTFSSRTRVVTNNGFNPYWNESFEFFLRAPELAVICFTVKDSQRIGASRFVGSYALPVNCLSPGKQFCQFQTWLLLLINNWLLKTHRLSTRPVVVGERGTYFFCHYLHPDWNERLERVKGMTGWWKSCYSQCS